jgi:type III pantothenate kinase
LIIDFGTAITIDYVEGGVFLGGNISPGMTTRFRALADYTAKLPLCQATEAQLSYGTTTREAIEQGVMQGITHEIEGYIEAFSEKKTKKCTIFTGGDAKYFVKRIKNTIFADCEPVLVGLNRILNYNAEKK